MDQEKQAKLKQWLKMYLLQSPGLVVTSIICVIAIIILLGLVAYFMRFRGEPSPNGSGTNYQCTSWSNAPAGIQEAITNSANSAGVHPAMLGAIFLAEHGNNWSDTASRISSNSDWINSGWQTDTSGKGARGPFQFLPSTWSSYGKGGNVQNFNDAAAGAARYIADGLKQAGLPINSSDQKSAYFVGLWYNAGNVATSWAKAGFDTSKPPSGVGWGENGTINGQSLGYAQRVWILLQGLNKGCDIFNLTSGSSPQVPKDGHVFPLQADRVTSISNDFLANRCSGTGSGVNHAHGGNDIMHAKDDPVPVFAVVDGIIIKVTRDRNGASLRLKSTNQNDPYTYFYQHLKTASVNKNDTVHVGQQIGISGGYNAGADGDHTHFGMMLNPNAPAEIPDPSCSLNKNSRASIAASIGVFDPYPSLKNWKNQ